MVSLKVAAPGSQGTFVSDAALRRPGVAPGLTAKRQFSLAASANWRGDTIVPAPTTASSTSPAIREMAARADGVRRVISMSRTPPFTNARASGTAVEASSITRTATTGESFNSFSRPNCGSCMVLPRVTCKSFEVRGTAAQGQSVARNQVNGNGRHERLQPAFVLKIMAETARIDQVLQPRRYAARQVNPTLCAKHQRHVSGEAG